MARTRMVRREGNGQIGAWLSLEFRSGSLQDGSRQGRASLRSFSSVAENPKPQCQICHKPIRTSAGTPRRADPAIAARFHPKAECPLSIRTVSSASTTSATFRRDYVKEVLQDEIGELTALDQEVIDSLQQHEILSENIGKEFEKELTFGERLSDRIASFGGSWTLHHHLRRGALRLDRDQRRRPRRAAPSIPIPSS